MIPTEAQRLKPGDRLVYDHPDAGSHPCAVELVMSGRFLIRGPEGGGMVVWFSETELMGRFSRAGSAVEGGESG